MKRPPNPFRYVTAEHTNKPGYLAKRMKMYQEQVQAEAQTQRENQAEAAAKVTAIKPNIKAKP